MKIRYGAVCFPVLILAALMLAGCRSEGDYSAPTPTATVGGTGTLSSYPKAGHAPDYSWVAGRVTFTKIQGRCVYVYTDPAEIAESEATRTPVTGGGQGSVEVGTAVHSDTSPPLRDITPGTGAQEQATEPPSSRFVASGSGWDESKVRDGDYVVLFGRLAGAGDPTEICPGGTGYVVDSWKANP